MRSLTRLVFTGYLAVTVLTGCGGGSSSSPAGSSTGGVQPSSENIQILGAGIKGPLAFADAKIFVADPSLPDFYDKTAPISSAMTDQYAQISGLTVPSTVKPPFILTIGGNQAIDLNTGKAPVISELITVITADMLSGSKPIYATPLTTLVFDMARYATGKERSKTTFVRELRSATQIVSDQFNVNADKKINVFSSPLVIDNSTDNASAQEEAVYHRAAVETFAAKVFALSRTEGNGLRARYFNGTDFSKVALERVDPQINFSWQGDSPAPSVNRDNFSIRWTGLVQPKYSEEYTFYTSTDDGVRLWVNGQLLIDNWGNQSEREHFGTIVLAAATKYRIVMEYYDNTGGATAKLLWSSRSQGKSIIPKKRLYSVSDPSLVTNLTPDMIIDRLALDLQSDGVVDNADNGREIGGIDPVILDEAPANMLIPNTSTRVADIISVMKDERSLLGTDSGPAMQIQSVNFSNAPLLSRSPVPATTTDTAQTVPATSGSGTADKTPPPPVVVAPSPIPAKLEAVISMSTSALNFPSQLVGEISSSQRVTVSNSGNAPLIISSISVPSGFLETNNCNNYLPAGKSCGIDVSFVPVASEATSGILKVFSDAANTPYTVALTGTTLTTTSTNTLPPLAARDSICNNVQAIFCVDHETVAAGHHVTDADITRWFLADQSRAGIINDKTGGAIDIVADPSGDPSRGKVMRIFNSEGARGFTDGIHGPSSGQWRSWPGAHDELYFAYDFYMEPGRAWTKGQKMPGLVGGDWAVASGGSQGGLPNGSNGFSARLMMFSTQAYPSSGDGALGQYTYYTNNAQKVKWYNDGPGGQVNLQRGKWYTIESYIKLNTPGVANGIIRAWVDGVKVLENTGIMWRTTSSLKLDGVFFTFGYGGGDDSWNATEDQYNYYDNWVLSTQPISH